MVKDVAYQPDRGDLIYLDFSPQAGTEQAGRRPGLVLSSRDFNIATVSLRSVPSPIRRLVASSRFLSRAVRDYRG